jgi:hypothetical protein
MRIDLTMPVEETRVWIGVHWLRGLHLRLLLEAATRRGRVLRDHEWYYGLKFHDPSTKN